MVEVWKDISGYEDLYQVSNFGRVRRLKGFICVNDFKRNRAYIKVIGEKVLKQFSDNNGYMTINLHGKRFRVHRLVANAFIPKIKGKNIINHIDGNKANNYVYNLEWCSYKENSIHAVKIGLHNNFNPKKTNVVMLSDNGEIIKRFNSITEAYNYFGLSYRGSISEVCKGKRKHFKGYVWRYGL